VGQFLVYLRRYFLTGLLVITPIWGTYLVLKTLLVALEGILGHGLQRYLEFYVPGLGIVVLVALILLVGALATNYLGKELVRIWEAFLTHVPIVRSIYTLVKSIVDTISLQQRGQFGRVVLVEFPQRGQYSIAYVTGKTDDVRQAMQKDLISVYVPTTPNPTSGYLLFVPEREVIPLSMSVEDSMKLIISGGLFSPKAAAKDAHGAAHEAG